MTAVPPRVPTPRLKALPTASTTTNSVAGLNSKSVAPAQPADASVTLAVPSSVAVSTASHSDPVQNTHHLAPRRPARPPPADPLSDKATLYLIRRTLCADRPREKGTVSPAPVEDLPPLTSRNDVDLQLYAFLSIILREFVQSWYNKITPDQSFVAEIVQIIAHVTRALEQRLRKVDLEHLLFQELPELLDNHINAYRTAHRQIDGHPIKADPRQVYHSLFPLPHLSPIPDPGVPGAISEQEENEANYRQLLVQGVLAVLLPTEDLENECLTSLVGQILSELIIGGIIAKKASEPWLLWEGITILARDMARKRNPEVEGIGSEGALSSSSTTSSTPSHVEPQVDGSRSMTRLVSTNSAKRAWSVHGILWGLVHWLFLGYTIIRLLVSTAILSRSLPSRLGDSATSCSSGHKVGMTGQNDRIKTRQAEGGRGPVKRPVLTFEMGPCIANLLELDLRMPWLCGVVSWAKWMAIKGPGRIAGLDGIVDRLLSNFITSKLLDAASIPHALRTLRGVLFPNNAPGTQSLFPPENEEELLKLRRKCARAVWELIPRTVSRIVFAGTVRAIPQLTGAANRVDELGKGISSNKAQLGVKPDRTAGGRSPLRDGDSNNVTAASGKRDDKTGKVAVVGAAGRNDDGLNQQQQQQQPTTTTISGGWMISEKGKKAGAEVSDRKFTGRGEKGDASGLPGVTEPVTQGESATDEGEGPVIDEEELDEVDEVAIEEIEMRVVDIFGDVYCNKHLMYSALELILVRLLPELGERGVAEMWEERLS